MVATTSQSQLAAIATKLADMRTLQDLMLENERMLMSACSRDEKVAERLKDMLEDDQKNIEAIAEAQSKLGIQAQADSKTTEMVQKLRQMMGSDELNLYEKAMQHEALKHQLVMTGLTVHKAAQTAGGDLEETIDPINKANFRNRAHQEQLKGIILLLGTRELVGKDPDDGVWAQAEDAIAALKGAFGGITE
ncbi:MAG: hemerythrin HHE cation-binding protein [Leptolyngbyaceae cyanobacterium SM1_1_3]|nr:hemerythrin HHE cation-binding protein [Leptolyngbyaceae cyanobacterium SM1_1_3]NJM85156.1 hemerythrin HHE cation-binding protein [Leptolyngbyaceae cyanobacterium RM2_2_21]NJN02162.1 hemerythrin HHE cation-binding protein [Leptolyngbyaceae cyanobacterium RM1_1_2]NJO08956.1 hemerythrin HHE cation-binding protein [Leptolyngbyaceae cyanobacterium SL_1_1]